MEKVAFLFTETDSPVIAAVQLAVHYAAHNVITQNRTAPFQGYPASSSTNLTIDTYHLSIERPEDSLENVHSALADKNLVAVIGPDFKDLALPVASLCGLLKVPQVVFSCWREDFSIPALFPYQLRTSVGSSTLSRVLCRALLSFSWSKAAVVYAYEHNAFLTALREDARELGIHLGLYPIVAGDVQSTNAAMQEVKSSRMRVVIVVGNSEELRLAVLAGHRSGVLGCSYAWISAHADPRSILPRLERDAPKIAEAIRPDLQGFLWIRSAAGAPFDELQAALQTTPPAEYGAPEALHSRWESSDILVTDMAAWAHDAVWMLAAGMAGASAGGSAEGAFGERLLRGALNASLDGASGRLSFAADGDRDPRLPTRHALSFLDVRQGAPPAGREETVACFTCRAGECEAEAEGVGEVVWADGSTEPPRDSEDCPQGMVYRSRSRRCVYLVAMALAMNTPERARNVLAALAAVRAVNGEGPAAVGPEAQAALPLGFRVEAEVIDTGFNPNGAVSAGLRARELGAAAVLGASRSPSCISLSSVLASSKTPLVSGACSSDTLSAAADFPFFARTVPVDTAAADLMAQASMLGFGWWRIAVLYNDDDWGLSFYQGFRDAARHIEENHGDGRRTLQIFGSVANKESIVSTMADMKSEGYRVFLVVWHHKEDLLLAARQLGMLGKGYMYIVPTTGAWNAPSIPEEELHRHMQGVIAMKYEPTDSDPRELLGRAMAAVPPEELGSDLTNALAGQNTTEWIAGGYGRMLNLYPSYAHDAMWAVALGLARAEATVPGWMEGNCTPSVNCHGEELAEIIKGLSFTGASGMVRFRGPGSGGAAGVTQPDRDVSLMNFVIKYYNSTHREWETAGFWRPGGNASGALEITSPIVWPGFDYATPRDGSLCEESTYFDSGDNTCHPCGFGSYSPSAGLSACSACDPGFVCPRERCKTCDSCLNTQYQDEPGQAACKECPANTASSSRGATSVLDCVCRPGYFRPDGEPGKECFPCPTGGVCEGGLQPPYPEDGFWGDWSSADWSSVDWGDVASVATRVKEVSAVLFHKCHTASQCTSDCGEELLESGEPLGSQATKSECRSNVTMLCEEGYGGRMCHACTEGFFGVGFKCFPCKEPRALFTLGTILSIIIVWYLLNRVAAMAYEAVDLMLIYFQNASTITAFSLNWDPMLVNYPFWILAVVNFDVTYITPECIWGSWSFGHSFVLQQLLPVIVIAIYASYYGANKAMLRLVSRCQTHPDPEDGAAPAAAGGRCCSIAARLLHGCGMAASPQELVRVRDECIAGSASFLNVVYHTMTLTSLQVFFCRGLPDGSKFVSAGPSVLCWEGAHFAYVVLGLIGLIVYTFGIPTAFFLVLRYGRVYNLFHQERFKRQWGWLYLRYEREWYFWEIVIMARRGLLVVVLVSCQSVPSLQLVMGIVLVTTLITSHFYARPFISVSLDYLDTFSLVSLMGLLCTGSLFYDSYGRENFAAWDKTVMAFCLLLLFGCMLVVMTMTIFDIKAEEAVRLSTRKLHRIITAATCPAPPKGDVSVNSSRRRDSLLGLLSRKVSAAVSCEDNARAHIMEMIANEPMELSRTIDAKSLMKWLKGMKVSPRRSRMESEEQRSGGMGVLPSIATKRFLSAISSNQTECSPEHQRSVVRFWLCNHWTRDVLADTSPVSYYSQGSYAMFFSSLVATNPYLIDYLLTASRRELRQTKAVINNLRLAQRRFSKEGRIVTLISEMDRGPLLAWLMVASRNSVEHLRILLTEIYQAVYGTVDPGDGEAPRRNALGALDSLILRAAPEPSRLGLRAALYRPTASEVKLARGSMLSSASMRVGSGELEMMASERAVEADCTQAAATHIGSQIHTGTDAPQHSGMPEMLDRGSKREGSCSLSQSSSGAAAVRGADATILVTPAEGADQAQNLERTVQVSEPVPRASEFGGASLASVVAAATQMHLGKGFPVGSAAAKRAAKKIKERVNSFQDFTLKEFDGEICRLSNVQSALTSELLRLLKDLGGL
eukprot:CAMPEP_0177586998 /NCGR_PEP_ID=MMETSP0419_2-20121207/5393_1 /TAXON_ID=582737 /ORGANISM="Tetraselmis sp., Strain GSL018" /LENGTH=1998 /DNA_ID=CAMNT_0019076971 /DNA_START=225 /DNA_END=6221 /DNA_ORIENTATION=-